MKFEENLETKAIAVIDGALSSLKEDQLAQKRVLMWAAQKYSFGLNNMSNVPQMVSTVLPQGAPTITPSVSDIKKFILEKSPKDGYQKLACLAYFLERSGVKDFNVKDLIQANTDAKQQRISNVSVYLGDATSKYGFFSSISKGKKILTTVGEAVVDALPDQEKVKEVMKSRKNKSKAKSKKKKTS